jgi:hypothetical protein
MEASQLNWITNFIWDIADDVLRDVRPEQVPGRHPANVASIVRSLTAQSVEVLLGESSWGRLA